MNYRYTLIAFMLIRTIYCVKNIHDTDSLKNSENILKCNRSICIYKCCPLGHKVVAGTKFCNVTNHDVDLTKVKIYDKDIRLTDKKFEEIFDIVPGIFTDNPLFKIYAMDYTIIKFNNYLEENGNLWIEMSNVYDRWTKLHQTRFCMDAYYADETSAPKFWAILPAHEMVKSNIYLTSATLLSCVFLLLVLIVYALLPELRNLGGMILMAYVASLFWAFLLLVIIQLSQPVVEGCFGLTLTIYFSFLASFCWMNVMSYDIWWTFRGYAKARPIHRRGERFKFLMYCLYGFGVPLGMTTFLGVANSIDLTHKPGFITPNIPTGGCFLEGGAKFLYLYVPMLIVILCNWIFYLMTAYNVWRLGRGTAVLANSTARGTPSAHRTQRDRLMLYLKLSIVMGLNWLFEVMSFVWPEFKFWYISDVYNILIGFAIFLIFVCKKNILRKLKKRYHAIKKKGHLSTRSYSSNTESSSNPETMTLQISPNPKGGNTNEF